MNKQTLTVSLFLLFSVPIAAPTFASPADDLAKTQDNLKEAEAKKAELEEQSDALQAELDDLQEQLVPSAATVQKYEAEISAIEDKLRILDEQMGQKEAALTAARSRQAMLVQAALRLARTPPEAALLMPGNQIARALQMTTESLRQEANSISQQMTELLQLRKKVDKKHIEIQKKSTGLTKEQKELQAKVEQRQALQRALNRQQAQEAKKIEQLAKKAEDLQQLIASLAEEEAKKSEEAKKQKAKRMASHGLMRSFAEAKGKIRPPVAGKLVQRFGRQSEYGSVSKGIEIASRSGAQVTAPYDGEVVFSGPFLHYGRMVIIRHSDDFHTLLAGLSKIDVSVGEFLLEGEPIGAMGEGESANHLYVELRKNNQPVDPTPWLKGIKK